MVVGLQLGGRSPGLGPRRIGRISCWSSEAKCGCWIATKRKVTGTRSEKD